jgi:HAMP domain-containing protein
MSLRLKLILMTTVVVTVLFGISEWLSYQQTTALLDEHEAILRETADHTVALQRLQATRDRMFVSVTTLRLLHAIGTLVIAVAILNYVWYRVIYRPIQRLLSEINTMGRGTWHSSLPVKRKDEIGELTTAFNQLGEQLTSTFQSINTSSKLSALALISSRIMRTTASLRIQIAAAIKSVERRSDAGISTGVEMLNAVQTQIEGLETRFQRDFDEELSAVSANRSPTSEGALPVTPKLEVRSGKVRGTAVSGTGSM